MKRKPAWQTTEEEYYAQKLDDKYGMSYELYVLQMADEGKIVLPFGKEPYEMKREEFYKYINAGYHSEIGKRNPKKMLQDVDKYGRREAERRWTIEYALVTGKSVPIKVLKDYPDLIFAKMDVQSISFNSHSFACYGKQTKRGFRAYCRRK